MAEAILDVLTRQISLAESRLEGQRQRNEDWETTASWLQSFRSTLGVFSRGVDLDDEAVASFVLSATEDGTLVLRWDSRQIRPSGNSLRLLSENSGLALVPGQCLLLTADLAGRLIEESLLETSAELRDRERELANLATLLEQCPDADQAKLLEKLENLDDRTEELLAREAELEDLRLVAAESRGGTILVPSDPARTEAGAAASQDVLRHLGALRRICTPPPSRAVCGLTENHSGVGPE